jgi:hypothetical protein
MQKITLLEASSPTVTACIPITADYLGGLFRFEVSASSSVWKLCWLLRFQLLSNVLFPLRGEFSIPAKRNITLTRHGMRLANNTGRTREAGRQKARQKLCVPSTGASHSLDASNLRFCARFKQMTGQDVTLTVAWQRGYPPRASALSPARQVANANCT